MAERSEIPEVHVYIDDAPTGQYEAMMDVSERGTLAERILTCRVPLDELYSLRLHVDNAIKALERRMRVDAVCGTCRQCQSTRMVHPVRHGRPTAEHCPRCHPKIERLDALQRTGL